MEHVPARPILLVLATAGTLLASSPAVAQLVSVSNVRHVGHHGGFLGGHNMVEGDRLYVGSYGQGLRIYDVSEPASPQLLGTVSSIDEVGAPSADAVPDATVVDGRHIAVLNGTARTSRSLPDQGRTDRTMFFDVTDPEQPVLLHTFLGPDDGEAHNGDIVDARRLWIPSGGGGTNGLRIYDLEPLLGEPAQAPANVFRGDPVALWQASPYRSDREVGPAFTHTHDVTVYVDYPVEGLGRRDILLLAEGGRYATLDGNTGSFFVIDITNPRAPVALLRWRESGDSGHEPIRYYHEAQFVKGVPGVVLVTDEDIHSVCLGGGVTALRLSPDLTDAEWLSEWHIPFGTLAPVCSVHVFDSKDGLVFFGSYNAGLQVVSYADPTSPQSVGHAILLATTAWGATWHQGFVYVGDMTRGLDVFEYTGEWPNPPGGGPDAGMPRYDAGPGDAGASDDAGDDDGDGDGDGNGRYIARGGGCAVAAAGASPAGPWALAAGLAAALALAVRRRRR